MKTDELKIALEQPTESLSTEIKSWLDINLKTDMAKIIKCLCALYNYGGGLLIIGFDDKTGEPSTSERPADISSKYNPDEIYKMVYSKTSFKFDFEVHHIKRVSDDLIYPVFVVDNNITKPVLLKKPYMDDSNNELVKSNIIFTRSHHANSTPSSTEIQPNDWESLFEKCFDNREANIGIFVNRYLPDIIKETGCPISTGDLRSSDMETQIPVIVSDNTEPDIHPIERLLQDGKGFYDKAINERKINVTDFGSFEVAMIILGNLKHFDVNEEYKQLVISSNPRHTGWPLWIMLNNTAVIKNKPYVHQNAWESLINSPQENRIRHTDFSRFYPNGKFYTNVIYPDDISGAPTAPESGKYLDLLLQLRDVTQALSCGLAFAKQMLDPQIIDKLNFSFRWSGLKKRKLSTWAHPDRDLDNTYIAYQDTLMTRIRMPSNTPKAMIYKYALRPINELSNLFDGFQLDEKVASKHVNQVLSWRF